jgi:cytochrome oxidase Cu insertion factor (SCO1/SenC/PrrC family)
VRTLRLSDRQWRIYLAVWLVVLAGLVGIVAGMLVPKLLLKPAPPSLIGDIVMNPPVTAPDFHLIDQSGHPFSLAGVHGQVVALTFLDTQCQSLCPLQASLLGSVQAELGKTVPLMVVVVSVRPEVDTPAAIATFAESHGLKGTYHWVNGTRPQLAAVWDSYGISVQPPATGDIAHSSVIYLIDKRGFERVEFADVPQTTWMEGDVRLLDQG